MHTHPECVSNASELIRICYTHDSDFATELILDLTRLDSIRRMLLNELEKVLDTHIDSPRGSIVRVAAVCERSKMGAEILVQAAS